MSRVVRKIDIYIDLVIYIDVSRETHRDRQRDRETFVQPAPFWIIAITHSAGLCKGGGLRRRVDVGFSKYKNCFFIFKKSRLRVYGMKKY